MAYFDRNLLTYTFLHCLVTGMQSGTRLCRKFDSRILLPTINCGTAITDADRLTPNTLNRAYTYNMCCKSKQYCTTRTVQYNHCVSPSVCPSICGRSVKVLITLEPMVYFVSLCWKCPICFPHIHSGTGY